MGTCRRAARVTFLKENMFGVGVAAVTAVRGGSGVAMWGGERRVGSTGCGRKSVRCGAEGGSVCEWGAVGSEGGWLWEEV